MKKSPLQNIYFTIATKWKVIQLLKYFTMYKNSANKTKIIKKVCQKSRFSVWFL